MELSGLEWEAEKAYIVAVSPSNRCSKQLENSDEFSWESSCSKDDKDNTKACNGDLQEKPLEAVSEDVPQPDQHEKRKARKVSFPNEAMDATTLTERRTSEGVDDVSDSSRRGSNSVPGSSSRPKSGQLVEVTFDQNSDSSTSCTSPTNASSPPATSASPTCLSSPLASSTSPAGPSSPPAASTDSAATPLTSTNLVIFGPSGLGRSTLVKKLVYKYPQKFAKVVSHTTRQPKIHETYARDFFFISRAEMFRAIDEDKFIEYVQIDRRGDGKNYSVPSNPRLSTGPIDTTVILSNSEGTELYGTSWEAYYEAQFSGKPCIVLNVSRKGAEQMRRNGIQGCYVLLFSESMAYSCVSFEPDYTISINASDAYSELERFALELVKGQVPVSFSSKLESTRQEWERVPNIQLDNHRESPVQSTHKQPLSKIVISFSELLNHFQTADLSRQLSNIRPEANRSGLFKLFGPHRISKGIRQERDLVFAIALCQFDDHNPLHSRCLTTIYHKLTGRTSSCPRLGTHWEEAGFQGSDPVDDLRGVGMLGLLQLVWLLENRDTHSLAQEVFRYSKEGPPFCVLSFNITSMMLAALREGCLSRECNRRDQVFAVVNDFHVAVLLSFYHVWRKHKRNPMELGLLLQDVGKYAKRYPRSLIQDLQTYLQKQHSRGSFSNLADNSDPVEFTQLGSNESILL